MKPTSKTSKGTDTDGISFSIESLIDCEEDQTVEDEPPSEAPPQRSQRNVQHPNYYGYSESTEQVATVSADTAALVEHCTYNVQEIPEPATIDEALESTHAKEWKLAIDSEYSSLMENDTWNLVELPEGRTAVGCKWVFKVKYDGEGKAVQFISQLVAMGYS